MTTLNDLQKFKNVSDRWEDKIISSTEITAATTGTSIATSGIPHSMQGVQSMILITAEEGGVNDIPSFTGTITFIEDGHTLGTFGYTMPATSAGSTATLAITAAASLIDYSDNYTIQYDLAYTAAYTIDMIMKKRMGDGGTVEISGEISAAITNLTDIPSSSGSGPSTYRNAQADFTVTVNSGAKTFDVSGLSWTLEAINVDKVQMITSAGVTSNLALTTISVDSARVTLTDITANFTGNESLAVTLIGPDKNRNQANDSLKVEELDPIDMKFVPWEVTATVASGTYSHYFPFDGKRTFAMQIEAVSTASETQIYASLERDVEASAATYVDVTNALVGSTSIVSSDIHFQSDTALAKWYRLDHLTTSGTYTLRFLTSY